MKQKGIKPETRGRPKNVPPSEMTSKLSHILQNVQMCYAMTFIWAKQITGAKKQKRVGHSQTGFNIYDKVCEQYCFNTLQNDLRQWSFDNILNRETFKVFYQYMSGVGPKVVLRELAAIGELFLNLRKSLTPQEALVQLRNTLIFLDPNQLDRKFSYIRFSYVALINLKLDRNNGKIRQRVEKLCYIVYCLDIQLPKNKYRQALFADTASWNDNSSTISLTEVVQQTEQDRFQNNTQILQRVLQILEERNGFLSSKSKQISQKCQAIKIQDDYQFQFQPIRFIPRAIQSQSQSQSQSQQSDESLQLQQSCYGLAKHLRPTSEGNFDKNNNPIQENSLKVQQKEEPIFHKRSHSQDCSQENQIKKKVKLE